MSTVQNKFLIFLIVLCYIPVLFLGLFDVDEGAFASTSLQMIKQKQYLIPTIGNELRLEKPILTYWVQVMSIYIFGPNEFALRLPSIIASFIWAYSFSSFVNQHTRNVRRSEIFLNLLTLPGVFIMSSAATADAFLNLFITLCRNNDITAICVAVFLPYGVVTLPPPVVVSPVINASCDRFESRL